ncbi:MAG: FHA domain-containing protein, partial [Deltaproteobacteria bacterium]|nr:FHA domain-containing protein [Deltaproteobacteria bacterium]
MDVGLVCDACSALTPIGVPQCKRCGAAVALDPRSKQASRPPAQAATAVAGPATSPCAKCNTLVADGTKFCPNCGARIVIKAPFDVETRVGPRAGGTSPQPSGGAKPGRSTLFMGGAMQSARAKLTLIRGDGEDGVSFTLAGQEHPAGRGDCPISFPDDPFLSPTHANFVYSDRQLLVRDEKSLNGIYVRIGANTSIELGTGGTVLVGEQVLAVTPAGVPEDVPDGEGTYYSTSIQRPATLEVRQQLRGGVLGWVFRPNGEVVTVGRENNDINFPDDPFISGRHAELRLAGGVVSVTDLGSRNGTFVRIDGERVLR